jgi:Protein of unknown function (DUF2384)
MTQVGMSEAVTIIDRVREWAGGEAQAIDWYRSHLIPALDGDTAEELVTTGNTSAVHAYLDHLENGGFA